MASFRVIHSGNVETGRYLLQANNPSNHKFVTILSTRRELDAYELRDSLRAAAQRAEEPQ